MTAPAALAGYVHRFEPSPTSSATTLLLLHGTGGDENDLVPLGRVLAPDAALLSPRGNVLERGMPRFFRRVAEGVFDQADLAQRTGELARFVADAAASYGFDPARLVAVGFSNGANIAASVLLRHPETLRNALLFRPMVPFEPETSPRLAGARVFIAAGTADAIAPLVEAERLAAMLREGGADVTLHRDGAGHTLTPEAIHAAQRWLAGDLGV